MAPRKFTERAAVGVHQSPSLLSIPLETFESIAAFVEPENLFSLRLVNRETEAKVHHTFVETHFTERISFDESLQTLLAIATHGEFSRTMRTVVLGTEELPDATHPIIKDGDLLWRSEEARGSSVFAKVRAEQEDREWH